MWVLYGGYFLGVVLTGIVLGSSRRLRPASYFLIILLWPIAAPIVLLACLIYAAFVIAEESSR